MSNIIEIWRRVLTRHKVVFVVLLLSGCSFFQDKEEDKYAGWTVDQIYAEARSALDSGDYDLAVDTYEALEARFPFGVYAQQAILDTAYAHYRNNEPDLTIAAADRFIELYPQNAHVDYVYYLKGLANYHRGKGFVERFLPLDESQRDPGSSMDSFQDFAELMNRYPQSRYAGDAKLRMAHLRNVLAQHEVNVAQFYLRRGAYLAAANRAAYMIEKYARTPSVPDALVVMARAYKIMELNDLSDDALRVLELNYPNHPGIHEIRRIKVE